MKNKEEVKRMLEIHKSRLDNKKYDQKMLKGAIAAYEWVLK